MIDATAAFRALLLTSTDIVAQVTRPLPVSTGQTPGAAVPWVFGAPPGMPSGTPQPPPPAIVIQKAGGAVSSNIPVITPRFYVRCYGPSGRAAEQLFGYIFDLLYDEDGRLRCNRLISNKWFMYWAQIEAQTAPSIEAQSGWSVAASTIAARFDAHRGQ